MKRVLIALLLIAVLFIGGCVEEKEIKGWDVFDYEDEIKIWIVDLYPLNSSACNMGYFKEENLITAEDCEKVNNTAECIGIPIEFGLVGLPNITECGGQKEKIYCQIKIDGKVLKEDCFNLTVMTIYNEEIIDLTKSHELLICCSFTDSKEEFDTCKSFVMEKLCD